MSIFPNALVMLALDERDAALLNAVVKAAPSLGVRRLVLLHVHRREPVPEALRSGLELSIPVESDALTRTAEWLRERIAGCEVETLHAIGTPAEEVAALFEGDDLDLVCIGRGRSTDSHAAWGPDGLNLLRFSPCSALIVPDGADYDASGCVCGLDFSHAATEALVVAVSAFPQVRAVYQFDLDVAATSVRTDEAFLSTLSDNVAAHFERDILPSLPADAARPEVELVCAPRASAALIEAAGSVPIVVGSRGMSRFAAMLLGSTAERVAGRANVPILIVRKKGQRMGFLEGLFHR